MMRVRDLLARISLISLVAVALSFAPLTCRAQCRGDFNGDGATTVGEVITVVDEAFNSCSVTPRFIDNGDGTITDRQTRLMWERKIKSPVAESDRIHNVDAYFDWSSSRFETAPNGGVFTEFLRTLNSCVSLDGSTVTGGFAGYCDWRIPSVTELLTILNPNEPGCGGRVGPPCTFPAFNPQLSSYYWTSTSSVHNEDDQTQAWSVEFGRTGLGASDLAKGATVGVRAVRGGN